jgi:glycogen phosphorylase
VVVTASTQTEIPERIAGLRDLAYNLWWSWNIDARSLFRVIDPSCWLQVRRNAVRFLQVLPAGRLEELSNDPVFLARYDAVMSRFHGAMERPAGFGWLGEDVPQLATKKLAYFSAEIGLHPTLPIYSGGLGVLAGDHLKAASDLGLPTVAVSLLYRHGYLKQRLTPDGWQLDVPGTLEPWSEPAVRIDNEDGAPLLVDVDLGGPEQVLRLAIWKVLVGRVTLYLLDSDVEGNPDWTRGISSRLYGGDVEHRLRQEIILGIGGVRALRAVGEAPDYWHGNEGHAALHLIERCRELVASGESFEDAVQAVRRDSVFTSHTPVAAGHDIFPHDMIERYFRRFVPDLGISMSEFLELGVHEPSSNGFNLTALSLRLSGFCNGVSLRHGEVTRAMWHSLWPEANRDEVPIGSITNGVHLPTWISRHMAAVYDDYLDPDWLERTDDPAIWERIEEVPDWLFWRGRRRAKRAMMRHLRDRFRLRWVSEGRDAVELLSAGPFLEEGILTIGFARRFATYKRATLIFKDPDRLAAILTNPDRPVQLVFAGKAHPADEGGKRLIQEIIWRARDPKFGGRIAFAEDYDMELAGYLVAGVDLWLNNPTAPLEASGTSGMKAAANGVPNLSILDGWWEEGWNPHRKNGWGLEPAVAEDDRVNELDAAALYDALENEVIETYYNRDEDGVPREWVAIAKAAVQTVAPAFSARRMVKEYAKELYLPAAIGE